MKSILNIFKKGQRISPAEDCSSVDSEKSHKVAMIATELPDSEHSLCFLRESPLRILRVAENGSVKEFQRILSGDPSKLQVQDGRGRRALHQASQRNHIPILKIILEYKEDLNHEDCEGNTALHIATEAQAVGAIDFLLKNGADGRKLNSKRMSILHVAAEGNKSSSLETLTKHLQGLLDVDQAGPQGRTPLHLACINNHSECVRLLVEDFRASPYRACTHSCLPIHEAARNASAESLQVLLQSCRKMGYSVEEMINVPDAEGNRALHSAVHGADSATVRMCLEAGAKISTPQKELSTAVHLACAQGSFEIVKLMFELQPEEKEKSLNSCDLEQMTPLHYAAMFDHTAIVQFLASQLPLMDQGAYLNHTDKNGWTSLHLAATRNAWHTLKAIIALGGDTEHQDKNGRTILHFIVKFDGDLSKLVDDDNALQFLNILETRDKHGDAPLHVAAKHGQIKSLAKLLKLGASITAKNNQGENVFHVACRYRKTEIILHLMQHPHFSSVINESNGKGLTPFHIAAREGHEKVLEILMKKGAFLRRDHDGRTPLHLAAENGHLNVLRLILNTHSHLINVADKAGNTALHSTAMFNRPKAAELLLGLKCHLTYNKEGYSAVDIALANKFVDVTYVLVTHRTRGDQVLELTGGKYPCIMIPLIAKMPGVARAVLDQSVKRSLHEKLDSSSYKIEYDFKWLRIPDGCGKFRTQKFLPILNEMVTHGRVNLLSHELCTKYLGMKWNAYGKYYQGVNLFLYLIFLGLLTFVGTSYYNKDREFYVRWEWLNTPENESQLSCSRSNASVINSFYHEYDEYNCSRVRYGHTPEQWHFLEQTEVCITFITLVNILVELSSFWRHGFHNCQTVNTWVWLLMNGLSFVTTGAYSMSVIGVDKHFLPKGFFNPGVSLAVFLAWFYLFLIMERFDAVGIYVSMYGEITKTMLRVLIIFSVLIVAFALHFYITLSSGNHTGFSDIPISIIRTISMMLGDLDFMNTFLYPYQCASMEKENRTHLRAFTLQNECKFPRRIPHPLVGFAMVLLYMILMPIVMINLLIGLAVGDIESVRKNAQLKRLSMQVQNHTHLEKLLPNFIFEKIEVSSIVEYPNVSKSGFNLFKHMFAIFNPATSQKDDGDEVHIQSDDLILDTLNTLTTDVDNVKGIIQLYCPMIQLLCEKLDVNLEDYTGHHSDGTIRSRKRLHREMPLASPSLVQAETFESTA